MAARDIAAFGAFAIAKHFPQAHSFPPSSLDRRSTELIVSPKKVVGCRGGSRNVEGCWGFPYLKIQKLANCHFIFFDRYEIHIQDFEDFYGVLQRCLVQVFEMSAFQNVNIPKLEI